MGDANVGQVELDLVLNSKQFKSQLEGAVNSAIKGASMKTGKGGFFGKMAGDMGKMGASMGTMAAGAGKLSGAMLKLGKIGLIIGAVATALKPVIKFSKEAVAIGSDMQEVQNVVDSVFTNMSEDVNKFAQDSILSYGLSSTATKKYMGTMGAMAQSFGFTEKEAFHMSKTLTGLVGDVASFYNLSHDEAYTKMKAVFTGETESLKELGIVMTQAALDEYAMRQGIRGTVSAMSEKEKVALRYRFIQDQLKTATGDFIRTQDGWANQTRMLSVLWSEFKGNLGSTIITVLTPLIKFFNLLMLQIVNASKAFDNFIKRIFGKKTEDAVHQSDKVEDTTDKIHQNMGGAAGAAQKMMKTLLGIDQLHVLTDSSILGAGGAGGGGGSFDIDLGIDEDKTEENMEEAKSKIEEYFEKAIKYMKKRFAETYQQHIKPLYNKIVKDFETMWKNCKKNWEIIGKPIWKEIGDTCDEIWNNDLKKFFDDTMGAVDDLIDLCEPIWDMLFKPLFQGLIEWALPAVGALCSQILNLIMSQIQHLIKFAGGFMELLGGIAKFLTGIFTLSWNTTWEGIKKTASGAWTMIKEGFSSMIEFITLRTFDFDATWKKVTGWMSTAWSNTCNWVSNAWENICNWFSGKISWLRGKWDSFCNWFKDKFSWVSDLWNKATGWLGGGGRSRSMNVNVRAPHLASGGYVPRNAPRLAMIGDNRHEGEIVAPESKLLSAVTAGTQPMMQVLQNLLTLMATQGMGGNNDKIVIPIYIDGEVVEQYIVDAERNKIIRNGGV